jgi:DNA-directed RNA polymerase specialized sigma24 family protein
VIKKICKKLAPRYTFGYYDVEDIEQEAFILAMTAIPYYDPSLASLETFLYIHLNNKLKTFKRDNYIRHDFECKYCGRLDENCEYCQKREWRLAAKKHLMEPIDIDHVNGDTERNMYINADFILESELSELMSIINSKLDIALREDYLKMLEGISISKIKRLQIEAAICDILEDTGYYHGRK